MDRRITRKVLGLHMAWLQAGETTQMTRERHKEMQWEFSQEAEYERRLAGREEWNDRCVLLSSDHPMVRAQQQELELAGSPDEPLCIPCPVPAAFRVPR